MARDVTEHRFLALLFGSWVLLAICLQTYAVFARNVLESSTTWVDDVQRLNFIWLIWICGALTYGGRGLVALDLVQSKLTRRPRLYHAFTLVLASVETVFTATFSWLSSQLVLAQVRSGESSVAIGLPLAVLNLGFAIGSVLFLLFALRKVVLTIQRLRRAEPVEEPPQDVPVDAG